MRLLKKRWPSAPADIRCGPGLRAAWPAAPGSSAPGGAARPRCGGALLHAPDQVVDHGAVAVRIVRAVGAAELRLGHHLRPGVPAGNRARSRPPPGLPAAARIRRPASAPAGCAARHAATPARLPRGAAERLVVAGPLRLADGPAVRRRCRRRPPCCRASAPNPPPWPRKRCQPASLSPVKARLRCVMRSRNWRAGWVRSLKNRESCSASLQHRRLDRLAAGA